MPSQERAQPKSSKQDDLIDDVHGSDSEVSSAAKTELEADVDAILDEIDDLLEVNAEDFVKSFVQKGGQ